MSDSAVRKVQKGKEPNGEKVLTEKQKTLPAELKQKIIESKKSGAGYTGSEDKNTKTYLAKRKPPPPKEEPPNALDEFWKSLGCDPKTGKQKDGKRHK